MSKSLLAGTLMLGLASPAFAAQEFFVALDTTANQCRVMMTQPDGVILRMVGKSAYSSLDEAQEAIAHLPECNS
ncbi:MAG TPA: hypothetical protein VNO69_10200 [Methyloceanibacter sp.]|jgi:hypothetical protein|nr:hypothetical protein [Methyloceanibacter sp.]